MAVLEFSLAFRSTKPVAAYRSNMALTGSMQVAVKFLTCGNQGHVKGLRNLKMRGQLCLLGSRLSSVSLKQYSRSTDIPNRYLKRPYYLPCQCSQNSGPSLDAIFVKNDTLNLAWSCKNWQGSPVIVKLALAVGVIIFIIWGLGPVVHLSKSIYQNKSDSSWKKASTYHAAISNIQRLFLWAGAMFICGTLDLVVPPTEAGKFVKQLLNFMRSMSTALACHHFSFSINSQAQKFMETNDAVDTKKRIIQVISRLVYCFLRVTATLSVIEIFGFSLKEWDIGSVLELALFTIVGDEVLQRMKADASTLTSKDDAADIRNPSTAAEDAVLASVISLDGISKELKDKMRQTSANVVSGATKKSLLASLDELREQISSVLDIDHPCGQSHITEARCAALSTSEEEDKAPVKLEPGI